MARCSCPRSDRKSTRLNSSHTIISYAVFCLKKKKYDDLTINGKPTAERARTQKPPRRACLCTFPRRSLGCGLRHVADPFLVGFFFFNDTATTEIYTLSLHDALPI